MSRRGSHTSAAAASSASNGGGGGGGGGGVSSAVRSGPSRSASVKALNAAGVTQEGANRYKYQGFNARIQNISIHFRSMLEPHELAADEAAAESRLAAANMFTTAAAAGAANSASNAAASAVYVPGAAFSSADLSSADASGAHSYFSAALASLGSTQLHREFLGFLSEVRPLVASFPLLLKNQKRVVSILLTHAAQPDNPAQAEIFSALSTLARDLRGEFTQYLGSVIETLLSVLDPSSPSSVESVFQSLAFLLKHQAKYIASAAPAPASSAAGTAAAGAAGVGGFARFFEDTFAKLLGHPKNYIRHFASESLAYLVRTMDRNHFAPAVPLGSGSSSKAERSSPLLSLLRYTPSRAADESFKDGLASTLFEIVKNIRFEFQTSHAKHVRALLGLLHTSRFLKSGSTADVSGSKAAAAASANKAAAAEAEVMSLREKEAEYQFELQMRLHRRMANYTRREQSAQVWSVLLETLEKRHAAALASMHDPAQAPQFRLLAIECSRLLQLVALWSSHRSGSRLPSHDLMRKVLGLAFGTLFQPPQPAAAARSAATGPAAGSGVEVEWKAQALSMLGKYWANFPALFTSNVLPSLRAAFAHLHVTTGQGAAAVVDEVGVENGALLLSFLESIRELQPNALEHLTPGVTAAAQGLLLSPARTPHLAAVARSLGLGLLMEINGLHPVGASYRIQALDEFHRASHALTPEQQRARRKRAAAAAAAASGDAMGDEQAEPEDEQMADGDAIDDEDDPDIEEEEVDPSSYATPLPQPTLYACSAHMFKLLSLSPAMQAFLVSQIVEALGEQQFSPAALAAAAQRSAEGAASGSTLLLSATPAAQRISDLWATLQLLSASGIDVSLPLSAVAPALAAKHQKQLAVTVADPAASSAASAPISVASLLLAFSSELTKAILALQSQSQSQSIASASGAVSTFIASTPLDSASAVAATGSSSSEDDSHAETNNHLLVGHALVDQLYFLRAQTLISVAALVKQRWSRSTVDDLSPAFAATAPRTALLPLLKSLTSQALAGLAANPEHIAVVAALDRVLEAAKSIQVGGVVDSELEADAIPATVAAGAGSAKKKKIASAHVPSASASSAASIARALDSVAELNSFLRGLFSPSAFSRQSLKMLPCLGSAHAFLRATALSVLRYYNPLRFISPEEEAAAAAKKKASASAAAAAEGDAPMDLDDDADAEGAAAAVSHTSELVGDCPVPSILHDLCLLSPTLEHEKEFVRLLKKLEVLVQSTRVPEAYLRLVPSVLLGLLHLKLNPLWSHVQKVLSSAVVMRYAVTPEKQRWIWEQVFAPKMKEIDARTQLLIKTEDTEESAEQDDAMMLDAHHARIAAAATASSAASSPALHSSCCLPTHPPTLLRFSHFVSLTSRSTDSFTYNSLLFAAFSLDQSNSGGKYGASAMPNGFARRLFDKQWVSQQIIDAFIDVTWEREYLAAFPNTMRVEEGMQEEREAGSAGATAITAPMATDDDDEDGEEEEESEFLAASASSSQNAHLPPGFLLRRGARKLSQTKLLLFLRFFLASLHKTSAARLPRANALRNICFTLLTKKDEELQRLALQALAKFQVPYVVPYLSTLQALVSEATWRDTMTSFVLAEGEETGNDPPVASEGGGGASMVCTVAKEHRKQFAAVLIRVLYPKLVQRKLTGKAGKGGSLSSRRAAILGFLGGLSSAELEHLVFLVMAGPFRRVLVRVVQAREKEQLEQQAAAAAAAGKKNRKSLLPATSSAASSAAASSAELSFEDILQSQVPSFDLPADSQALVRALLVPALYKSAVASAASASASGSIRIPPSKCLGFLHMLDVFLTKLRTLSMPYLKHFVVQLAYMVLTTEIQLEKYRAHQAQQEAEEKAAAAAAAEEEEKQGADETMADENEEEEKASEDDELEAEDEDDAEDAADDAEAPAAAAAEAKEEEAAALAADSDDEAAPASTSRSRRGSTASSASAKRAVPHALSKYLSELREIRQLAFTRMATILEQYPSLFAPEESSLPFKPLPAPTKANKSLHAAEAETAVQKLEGPSLAPYLQFFLTLCWPSLRKLATEGTQHAGGLWSIMIHLSSHHALLTTHFLQSDPKMLEIGWRDAERKRGLMLSLQSAKRLLLLPASAADPSSAAVAPSPFPLFSLLQASLGARSVHGSVVSAILSISEQLLAAKEDALSWEATRAEMEEIEAERAEKHAAQVARARERRKNSNSKMATKEAGGRTFRDESSDDEGAASEEDVALSHRLVQIETLYLTPLAHSARVRQYYLSHYSAQLHKLWESNVDAYLAHMHRWLTSLSILHAASNGRGIPAQANSTLAGHKSLSRKAAAAQAAKQKRGGRAHTSTFFPRRELEVLSSISSFASSPRTAKLLVDLLVPFVHSPEKQYLLLNLHAHNTRKTSRASAALRGSDALERHKPPPTLHNTLLHILLHLAPLLPLEHVEQLLEQLHKLLFSLRSNTHRALLTDLYVQLAASPAITAAVAAGASSSSSSAAAVPASFLPLYAPVLKSLNALHARRIEEYDDATRLEMYAALEAAFERELVNRGLELMERAEQEEAALTGAAVAVKGKKGAAAAAATSSSKPLLLSPRTPTQLALAAARRVDLESRRSELDQSLVSTSSARSLVGREGAPSAAMFAPFFTAYFSRDLKEHQKALGMLRPLVYNLAHDLVDDDLGTRSSGCSMLRKLIAFLAMPTTHTPVEEPMRSENAASLSNDMRVALSLRDPLLVRDPPSLLTGQLFPVLKRSLKHPADKVRRDVVAVLRDLITTFPIAYRHMLVLVEPADGWFSLKQSQAQQIGSDTGDFLDNIVHIQLHSRRRALTRLYQKVTTQDPADPNIFHADPSKALDAQTITQIIMPLLHHFIYDTSGAMNNVAGAIGMEGKGSAAGPSSGGHSGTMSTEKQRQKAGAETTLLEESIKLGGKLSAFLPWASYFHQVQVYLKLLRARPALERVLVRLVCACIREWHFEVEETAEEVQLRIEAAIRAKKDAEKEARKVVQEQRRRERALSNAPEGYEEEEPDEQMDDAETAAAEAAAKAEIAAAQAAAAVPPTPASLLARKIRSILTSHLLPQLHSLLTGLKVKQVRANKDSKVGKHMQTSYDNQNELTSKSGMAGGNKEGNTLELVRVPVAMALVALLRKLPESIFHAEFPRLLTALCIQLQHREQQARDLTRSTLLDILALLGPFYFHFFVAELQRHLTSGYMLHVLGHMIYACLDVLVNKMHVAPGSIDHSIVPLMDIVMNDLLGEPAKQKEVAAIRAATKEARINHASDCFQLLASVIAFPGSIHYLIDPFRFKLAHDSSLRSKDLALLADTLKKISVGLMHNPSVLAHIPDLLVYVHNYLFKNVSESFQALFPTSADSGKLSKQDKRANASKQNRHRKLEIVQDKNPLEQLREENKARSEGKIASGGAAGHASRKAMEFLAALQSSQAGHSSFERTTVAQKTSKDETFMLVRAPAPSGFGGSQSRDGAAISSAHHSNVILVFGLNLLYFTLKHKKLALMPGVAAPTVSGAAASSSSSSSSSSSGTAIVSAQEAASNLQRLDPFLHLIRDYCLVMGSALGEESNAAQRTRLTKEGDKKITRSIQPTSSSAVIHAALKVSEHLLSIQGLPSLQLYLRDLTNYMFALIHSKADPVILGACYSNLSVILRAGDWKSCGISAEKQKLLLRFIQAELMNPTATSATSVAFRLLQSILSRGVELPELYDFIIIVSQLMVTSAVEEVRKQSAAAVYSFLYNYKLGAARMHTHLGFLLNQLSYPHATGRAAVLQLFHSIFSHFAPTVLEEQLEFLSLPLIVHLVNESDADNKRLLNSVLSVLFSKVGSQAREKIVKMVYGWWKDEETAAPAAQADAGASGKKKSKLLAAPAAASAAPAVRSPQSQLLQFASLHVVCILVEVMKADYTGSLFLGKTVAGLASIVREKLAVKDAAERATQQAELEQDADASADEESDQSGVGSSWRVLYSTLLALEKLFKFLPGALLTSHLQQHEPGLFPDLLSCLLYPHTWVRTAACRIAGFVLGAIPMQVFNPQHARAQLASTLLATPSRFFSLVRSLTLQLQSPHLDDALAEQIVKNLVWASVSAHHIGPGAIWENLEGDEEQQAEAEAEEDEAVAAEDEQEEADQDADINDDDEQEGAEDDAAMIDVPSADEDEADDEDATAAAAAPASKKRNAPAATSAASAAASSIPSVLPTSNTLKRKQQKHLASLAATTGNGSTAASASSGAAAFAKSENRILNWLFTRLSYMCRREEGTKKRESIFRYFATMSSSLPVPVFACFLLQVINPLYRLAEGQVRAEEAELKAFASAVLEMVQKHVGTAAFLRAYTHVRAQVQSVRQARSIKKKSMGVMHPAQAAQRKQNKNDQKRSNKKRKIQLLKSPKARAANAAAASSSGAGFSSLSATSSSSSSLAAPSSNAKKQRHG